jgi:[FeFe] hydrogenase H-cluster maturation GTPase HydF
MRLHIGIYGRRNVGKSSFLNALTRQQVAIVSDTPGTTTDPVEKAMELLPIGPVLFIDTAGLDDAGALGMLRMEKTRQAMARTDVALILSEGSQWGALEEDLLAGFAVTHTPVIAVFNKADRAAPGSAALESLRARGIPAATVSCVDGRGMSEFRQTLIKVLPEDFFESPSLAADLVPPGEVAVLVVPIDLEAPKGRLILAQVQTIRDLLDHDAYCVVVKERELKDALDNLKRPPALVITDSQAFLKVAADTPPSVPLTSFSILFARLKGDLNTFVEGATAIDRLQAGDRVLIAEACTHHPIGEDIGRVKIPRWLTQYVGGKMEFDHIQGLDFPADLSPYRLAVHCGSCTFSRRSLMSRLVQCREAGLPISNYGVTIAYSLGILERALALFPSALDTLKRTKASAAG